ncbi:hypothetical protein K438DRAFT_606536 [Mycena galopus ATCC 62051]|nr:hypothetical protein K438DRAFT_606536 [Mycena galopus ATCC 62051]
MPYSPPGVVAPSLPSPAPSSHSHAHAGTRPNHRRSYTFAADDPRAGPGAFGSLGALPRRSSSHSHSFASSSSSSSSPRKFHFRGEVDNDDSSSSSDEQQRKDDDDDDGPPPPLRLRQAAPAFRLTPATTFHGHRASPPRSPQRSPNSSATNVPAFNAAKLNTALSPVPFPRSSLSGPNSPLSPNSNGDAGGGGYPTRPAGPARTASHPVILLSNGKPLKSSLKSSSSAPHVLTPNAPPHHLRARSAPSTPMLGSPPSATPEAWAGGDSPLSPSTPKAVHFPRPTQGSRISASSSAVRAPRACRSPSPWRMTPKRRRRRIGTHRV